MFLLALSVGASGAWVPCLFVALGPVACGTVGCCTEAVFFEKMLLVCSLVGAFLVGWLELSLAVCFPPGFWLQGPSLLVGFSSARLFASCGAAL